MMPKPVIKKYMLLVCLMILGFALFIYLENRSIIFQIDEHKNLDERSVQIMTGLNGEEAVKFDVFIDQKSVIAKKIKEFFQPFQRLNSELQLNFIDPLAEPDKAQLYGITMQGEMVLSYQDEQRIEHINITELSESSIMNAVLRLRNIADEWLVFAEGYGMREIDDETATGLSQLLIHVKKIGIPVARMPLNPLVKLPENVKVLVLPVPSQPLDEQMVAWLMAQLDKGISVWWINDLNSGDQTSLELALDVISGDKTALYDDKYTDAISVFPQHLITENFNQPLYLAQAREIVMSEAQPLWQSDQGVTLAASRETKKHRLLVTGDGDFISNQYLNLAANRSFAERMVDWLLYHDDRINLAVQINQGTQLYLSQTQLLLLSVVFLILFPFFFIIIAWRQIKARRTNES